MKNNFHSLDFIQGDPLEFALYGLDRQLPMWETVDYQFPILNLGPGNKHIYSTDELEWPDWDGDKDPLPYEDESVGGVFATQFLEHLADPRPLIREVGRVLRTGCPFNILVPHADSLLYKKDLDHKTPFAVETWKTIFDQDYCEKSREGFNFEIGVNFLFGLKEEDLCLITQLIKKG